MKIGNFSIGKGWIIAAVLLIVGMWVATTYVSYFNRERTLRAAFANEQRANQADFDNMWKTIAQKYQIKGDFENTFKAVFAEVAAGRQGGALFKSVQEAAPGFPDSMHRELMATIEGKRNQFESHQLKLSDLKNEHDTLITTFPGNVILSSATPLELKMVTSSRTDNAFTTGQDDSVELGTAKAK